MATRSWEFFRELDASSGQPLFLQLASAIARDIAARRCQMVSP